MRVLSLDIETYSSVDLAKSGVYAYTEGSDFEILLFGYAFDDEEVKVIDLKNNETCPQELMQALTDPAVIKTAFNVNFERICIGAYFNMKMITEQWNCTAVKALTLGLPTSLEGVSRSLGLQEQKLSAGKELVKYFSIPCKGNKFTDNRTRNLPNHDSEKWRTFKEYCKRDVEVERNIRRKLDKYKVTDSERKLWFLDQRINDRGVRIDREFLKQVLQLNKEYENALKDEASTLVGIDNPKSAAAMKKWLYRTEGMEVKSLSREKVEELIDKSANPEVKRALELRLELSKTSVKKYEAMERAICRDGRIRGLLQFYGASRTGRWAGRLVQVHNLPQNKLKDLNLARDLVKEGRYEMVELLFDSVPGVLSQLIRTAFIPTERSRFIIADFNSIEARVIAWLAGEKWRMEVFNSHGKIYEASASQMFRVPLEEITKESPLRQKGKIAELALGYQGGKGALLALGALKMGLSEEDLHPIVTAWRNSNPNIVKLWNTMERTAISAVRDNVTNSLQFGIEISCEGGILFVKLPSGRKLCYLRPRIDYNNSFKRPVLSYEGLEQTTKQWSRINTYGGKLVENIVQAVARDCLAEAMMRLESRGYKIILHIHDEVVLDVPYGFGSDKEVQSIMAEPVCWAKGLPLRAEAFECEHYRK